MVVPANSNNRRIIIGIIQPTFLPWLGYFEQIACADHFVLLDDVQYTHQDWRNRNRIKTASGPVWLTVPIRRRNHRALISEIVINYEKDWVARHLKTIRQNYGKCRYSQPLFSELEAVYRCRYQQLVELDVHLTKLLCQYLQIDTPISLSSQIPRIGDASEVDPAGPRLAPDKNLRLIEICRHFSVNLFYEGASGASYIDIERFQRHDITVVFQNYRHPTYPQRHGEFLPYMSVVDLIMNTGPEAGQILRSSPVPEQLLSAGVSRRAVVS